MSAADYAWATIGPDAWLLVDGPATATSGVIRAYLIGIEADDWLWRGVGGEGRSESMERAMVDCQLSVLLALHPEALFAPDESDESIESDGSGDEDDSDDAPDESRDFIDDLLDPDA